MKQKFITKSEKILGGAPVIKGTRIPAERIAYLVKQGYTEGKIKEEFPGLPASKIRGALFELAQTGLKYI